jgi:hypothetical protein
MEIVPSLSVISISFNGACFAGPLLLLGAMDNIVCLSKRFP